MSNKSRLRQAALAVGISALTLPAFAQGPSGTPPPPSAGSGVHSGSGGTGSPSRPEGLTPTPLNPTSSSSNPGPGTTTAGKGALGDHAATEADRDLNQQIRKALGADTALGKSAEQLQLNTEKGEVTLRGTVATEKEKVDIAARVQQMEGVKKVNNRLQMAPHTGATSGGMGTSPSGRTGSSMSGSTGTSGHPTEK